MGSKAGVLLFGSDRAVYSRPAKDAIMRTLSTLLFLALLSLVVACGDATEPEATALPIPTEDASNQEDTSDPDVTDSDATAGDTSGGDTATFEDDCGDGMICILGECKERSSATSCIVFPSATARVRNPLGSRILSAAAGDNFPRILHAATNSYSPGGECL